MFLELTVLISIEGLNFCSLYAHSAYKDVIGHLKKGGARACPRIANLYSEKIEHLSDINLGVKMIAILNSNLGNFNKQDRTFLVV